MNNGQSPKVQPNTSELPGEFLAKLMNWIGALNVLGALCLAFYLFFYTTAPYSGATPVHPDNFGWFGIAVLISGGSSAVLWWGGASILINLAAIRRRIEARSYPTPGHPPPDPTNMAKRRSNITKHGLPVTPLGGDIEWQEPESDIEVTKHDPRAKPPDDPWVGM